MTTRDTPEAVLAAALKNDQTVKALTIRLGRFNDAWWDRFARDILAALPPRWCGHEADIADAQRWRDAEAEGHVVDFTATGYGLQHPPSCRPNLIGCTYNRYLASKSKADRRPGRYRMTLDNMVAKYDPIES